MGFTRLKFAPAVSLAIGLLARTALVTHPAPAADKTADMDKAEAGLTVAEFDKLHARLTKMSTEKVWSIPWRLSVRDAREAAAKQNRPIFLWISNNGGTHPLGPC